MGNTLSKACILGTGLYLVALSVSAYITLVCHFGIPRDQVVLLQPVHAQTAPTITASGSILTTMDTTGSFGTVVHAKLDASQSVLIMTDETNGVIMASAAPYAFDKRTTSKAAGMCSFDGTEVSSPSTSNIYYRQFGSSGRFLVFKYSDLSNVVEGGTGLNPLYVAGGSYFAQYGMITIVGTSMFATSNYGDGKIHRVSLSNFIYSGTVTTTKSAQDSDNPSEIYRYGACDSGSFCYTLGTTKKLAKFTQDTAGSPTYVSSLNLNVAGQLDSGSISSHPNVVIDSSANNKLYVAATSGTPIIAKINLATFTFESRVSVSDAPAIFLCDNCFTYYKDFMMIVTGTSAKNARFIKLDDMTEVTDAGTSVDTTNAARTGWLCTNSNHGGIVTSTQEVQKLTSAGVVSTTSTTTTTTSTTTTTDAADTSTTTTTPSPPGGNNNNQQQQQQGSSSDQGVVVIATTGSILAVALIAGVGFIIYKFGGFASSSNNDAKSDENTEPTTAVENNSGEELKEVK